jgi:hypothetical protein
MSYLDVGKDGPLVVEVPQGLQGMFDDFWQRPLLAGSLGARVKLSCPSQP